jgi:signal transduction histidine kinase/ligand-binding sensor domain-containing protein
MPGWRRDLRLAVLVTVVVQLWPAAAAAERLALRKFSTADGLANDYIADIFRDSRGFLWFSTREGLSRFDGTRFTSYGTADGLRAATVNCVLETRSGALFVGTNGGGVARLNADGGRSGHDRPLFEHYDVGPDVFSARVNVLFEDRSGRVWAGTDGGLFWIDSDKAHGAFRPMALPPVAGSTGGVAAIAEDRDGSLWIGASAGIVRRLPDGRLVQYDVQPVARSGAGVLVFDHQQRLWAGLFSGIAVIEAEPVSVFAGGSALTVRTLRPGVALARGSDGGPGVRWITTADGLPHERIASMLVTGDGHVWVGTVDGVAEFAGDRVRTVTTRQGLPDGFVAAIAEDHAGNVWFGTLSGAARLIRHGLVTYDTSDGLSSVRIQALGEDASGRLSLITNDYVVNRFDGTRFSSVRPSLPDDATCNWTCPFGYLDTAGDWWLLTTRGLYHFAGAGFGRLGSTAPVIVYPSRNGSTTDNIFRLFEDRSRDVWIGGFNGEVSRWNRATGAWRAYAETDGLPPLARAVSRASAFAQDRSGSVWVGFYEGGVARFRGGRFESFGPSDGVPGGFITAISTDGAGRIWIGTNERGLARVDDPAAPRPRFVPVTVAQGLASNNVRCLTEDRWGRTYVGTSRGIDRIDPVSGSVQHYTMGEGLASDFVTSAFRDRRGTLWFGTVSGLSRLDPIAPDESADAPASGPVLIGAVRLRGVPQPLSELGEVAPAAMRLAPDQNQIEIDYFAVSFSSDRPVRYQYRLEGSDPDWSPATDLRRVNYARLAPGSYRFMVRAVRSDGAMSQPATVRFSILPPIYLRWWFMAMAATMVAGIAVAAYRVRVRQLLRLERVRARIATDLHDDIGASLSQIAILAEVARQRSERDLPSAGDPLTRIAETSRGLVDSMSDIVWAVNPEADSLSDLVHRMRRFAEDTLGPSDVELTFRAPAGGEDLRMGPDIRREILLILKESVTNIAKHARCTTVTIDFECDRQRLRLRIVDDGVGFDPANATDGNGVASMRRRVKALGGTLAVESSAGAGTRIDLTLDRRRLHGDAGGLLQP